MIKEFQGFHNGRISGAIEKAREFARKENCTAHFVFNEIDMYVGPDSNVDDQCRLYDALHRIYRMKAGKEDAE